jgi:hypothetical protein
MLLVLAHLRHPPSLRAELRGPAATGRQRADARLRALLSIGDESAMNFEGWYAFFTTIATNGAMISLAVFARFTPLWWKPPLHFP